jgi:hypothetical protein
LEPTGIGELTIQNKLIDIFFNLSSSGGKAFLELLLPRLNPRNINGGPAMPFQLEVMDMLLLYSSVFSQKNVVFICIWSLWMVLIWRHVALSISFLLIISMETWKVIFLLRFSAFFGGPKGILILTRLGFESLRIA